MLEPKSSALPLGYSPMSINIAKLWYTFNNNDIYLMQLKILSWNIWLNGDFDQIKKFLKTSNADIIGLQEVEDHKPTRDVIGYLNNLGYRHVFAPIEKTWDEILYNDGPAIFSKFEILDSQIYQISETDPRVVLQVDIQISNKILHVFNTHLVHAHMQESEEQTKQGKNLIKVLTHDDTVVMGDFNATPDVTVIKNMQNVLVDSDPSSAATWSVYPEGCSKCKLQTVNTRFDYIFTSNDIKTNSFKVEKSKASDHLPISVNIEV